MVKVSLENSNDPPKIYSAEEISVVRSGKGKRPEGYVAPPPEELAKLRKNKPEEEAPAQFGERSRLSVALEEILTASETREETPAQRPEEPRNSRNRNRNRGSGARSQTNPQPTGEKQFQERPAQRQNTKPKQSQTQRPKQERPQQDQPQQGAESAKKPAPNRRRSYRKPKAKQDGGTPPGGA
jgi:hypothetical protein